MNQLNLFLIETFIGIFVSGIVIVALLKPLRKILIDICGNSERAGFWVAYSNVMLVIAPLLTIIMFGKSNISSTADFTFYKTAFGCSLSEDTWIENSGIYWYLMVMSGISLLIMRV